MGVKKRVTSESSQSDPREILWVISKNVFFWEEILFLWTHLILSHFLHSKSATDVKVTADMVKEALEEAEKAQIAAEKAIKQADEDIQGTQNLLTSVSYYSHYNLWQKSLT